MADFVLSTKLLWKNVHINKTFAVGIYKRNQESKKTRKHPLKQESDREKKKENTLSTKKVIKKTRKKTRLTKKATKIKIKNFLSFFLLSCFLL